MQLCFGFASCEELLACRKYLHDGVASGQDRRCGQSGSDYRDSESALEDRIRRDSRLGGGAKADENPGESQYDTSLGVKTLSVRVHCFPFGGNLV